jgi:hypothetical protein
MAAATLKVLGVSDEVTTCGCCGRTDLKKTVAIGTGEGDVRYFGTDCASRYLGWATKDVEKGVRSAAKAAREQEARERNRRYNEERAAYDAWKIATFGDTKDSLDRHRQYRAAMGS